MAFNILTPLFVCDNLSIKKTCASFEFILFNSKIGTKSMVSSILCSLLLVIAFLSGVVTRECCPWISVSERIYTCEILFGEAL